ncbi:hypothetical protein HBI40_060000 [Parastagonospora nodorum]|nr:hypothetical protein HBI41_145690 [Parastagonospora nodorum]KAH6295702.1 hypothetical protein HBI40_060000 [Parastagonospora nodorum]
MSPPRYNYQPLEDKEHIRVLELRPNKLRIEIHIVHVAVSSRCYQALSYVWGEPDQSYRAFVLDQHSSAISSIPLTKNLHNALCDLRNTKDMKNRTFWIDQISINQQDDHEKGLQVSMMSQVYSQAQRVVTYLGPEESPDQERKGLQLLERIYKNILDNAWNHIFTAGSIPACKSGLLDGRIGLKSIPLDVCVDSNKETPTERQLFELGWIWLVRVAYGEWTQRLWIVQEQILNPEIIILRGHQLIEWDAIATIPILFAIGFIPRVYLRIIKRIMSEDEFSRIDTEECLYSMWWERRARFMDQPPYGQTLVFNIRHYAGLLCGNPLDRVYAILAISSDTHDLALAPDYSRTFEELTKEVSVRTFNLASNLQVLGIASKWRRTGLTLPSWCFMFGGPSDLREIPSTTSFDEYEPHPISSMVRPARFVSEDSVLVVKGRIVDVVCVSQHRLASSSQASLLTQEVTKIGEPDQRLEVTNSADKGGTLVFSSSLCDLLPDDPSSEDLIHLFYIVFARLPWSLPIVDQMSPGETTAFHFLVCLQRLRSKNRGLDRLQHAISIVERYCSQLRGTWDKLFESSNEYKHARRRMSRYSLEKGRVLGRTRAGRLYNAMQGIEDGDVIMALQGADQLHVMRPCGDMFKLIGDIYVDGLMFGEAYVGQDPNEVDYEISIC